MNSIPHHQLRVGDVLRWQCDTYPQNIHRWRVHGIHIGGKREDGMWTESLIECESVTHAPGWTGPMEYHPRVFLPEVLVRSLTIEDVGEQFGLGAASSRRGAV